MVWPLFRKRRRARPSEVAKPALIFGDVHTSRRRREPSRVPIAGDDNPTLAPSEPLEKPADSHFVLFALLLGIHPDGLGEQLPEPEPPVGLGDVDRIGQPPLDGDLPGVLVPEDLLSADELGVLFR